MRTRSSLFAALRLLPVLGALACGLTTAQAGTVTAYTALEEDEIKEYLAAAKKDLPDVDVKVLRLSTGDLGAQLSQMLPQVVDQATPGGQLPEGGLGDLGGLLGGLLRR